jgi:protease YdgD
LGVPAGGVTASCGVIQRSTQKCPLAATCATSPTRQHVDGATVPWQSLGRVQTELGQRCTGTLIAPDRVLTAAHCLIAPRRDQLVQPGSVHFLLGYAAGQFRAHRRVVAFPDQQGLPAGG